MSNDNQDFWDFLSTDEAEFMKSIVSKLCHIPWAQDIIGDIGDNRGWTRENKARFFELRFAYALHQSGVVPSYEVVGEGQSTFDFGFTSSKQKWVVELMRFGETKAARSATRLLSDDGILWSERVLSSHATDNRHSEEGETLKAVQRICQKLERNGQPHKFSVPTEALHVILVDSRTFLNGGDVYDQIHVAFGGEYLKAQFRRYWDKRLISGVFNPKTDLRGAPEARARLHFIGFVTEKLYQPGEFAKVTRFFANPYLLDHERAEAGIAKWPLHPAKPIRAQAIPDPGAS